MPERHHRLSSSISHCRPLWLCNSCNWRLLMISQHPTHSWLAVFFHTEFSTGVSDCEGFRRVYHTLLWLVLQSTSQSKRSCIQLQLLQKKRAATCSCLLQLQLSSPVAAVAKEEPHRIPHIFVLVSFGIFLAVSDLFFLRSRIFFGQLLNNMHLLHAFVHHNICISS